ncbi:bone sialoprotein 2-like isoform X2 [Bufo bufo]|uniref:bone sialoprotein 2-like isoform X2 n=1 Tax=Bufo bufo TaxID=8384 RepID=UPI001ABE524F|nr:bone sialoprotein 2-like isoform X2 [Bufo bufo]
MEQSDRRPSSEEDESTQETRESCSSQLSSLEMDCSEPYGDQTEGSNNQEMKSASSSLESYMDCSEDKEEEEEEEEEEERRKENEDNDKRISGTCIRENSLTLTVSSVIGETETSNGNENGGRSSHRESLSQDLSVTVQMNISVSSGHGVDSSQTHKRKISEEDEENMNKRRKSGEPDSTSIQVVFPH